MLAPGSGADRTIRTSQFYFLLVGLCFGLLTCVFDVSQGIYDWLIFSVDTDGFLKMESDMRFSITITSN